MALLQDWYKTAEDMSKTPDGKKFWDDYFGKEKEIYEKILVKAPARNTVKEFAEDFGVDIIVMTAFLDGINDSLKVQNDLEELTEDSEVNLEYDLELLYKNMVDAKADWLYELPEWDNLLTGERRKELFKEQRSSKTVVKTDKVGRNDPCPCGSGKKFKKCCGRD